MNSTQTISGVFRRHIFAAPDSPFRISIVDTSGRGSPDGEVTVKGDVDSREELASGSRYTFQGQWESSGYNGRKPAFRYRLYVDQEPLSREEVVAYLQRKLRDIGIGYGTASRIYDAFKGESIERLRNDPDSVASNDYCRRYLSQEKAREASRILISLRATAEAEIKLIGLLNGRGFPHALIKQSLRYWGVRAASRIKHDPFALLIAGFAGCGFARCDKLYSELGCSPHRLKRQAICLWHLVHEHCERSGDTWMRLSVARQQFDTKIAGTRVRFIQAVKLAIHRRSGGERSDAGPLSLRKLNGEWLIAETAKARQERTVADRVTELLAWTPPAVPDDASVQEIGDAGMARYAITDDDIRGILEGKSEVEAEAEIEGMIREGRESGVCQFCGRELTNPESRERGYGPVCAEKWGLTHDKQPDED